jgi:hypothetical protein
MRVYHAVAIAGLCLLTVMRPAKAAPATANFRLQAAISERIFGPFTYTDGARIRLETGDYLLRVLGGTRFRLVDPARERSFGDYELVLGRMIDVDETLFTIAEILATREAARQHEQAQRLPTAATAAVPPSGGSEILGRIRGFFGLPRPDHRKDTGI